MKKTILILPFLIFFALATDSSAAGIGINFGQPHDIALSLKSSNSKTSYDFAVSWANSGLYLHANYLLSTYIISRTMPLYAGLGLRTNLREGSSDFGLRIPLGMSMYFSKLEVFFEIAPSVMLLPSMSFFTDPSQSYGIGVRYHISRF
ncbi:hypothetical protein CHISP_1829 [Chitinispirillum alkaliphilum]|nr:hypothetical protein CHISP_1829 [Chitinispirillum alkaliphilum]